MSNNNDNFGYDQDSALKDIFSEIKGEKKPGGSGNISLNIDSVKTLTKQIRLTYEDYNILLNHFKDKGIRFATGVRMILVEYIKKNDLK